MKRLLVILVLLGAAGGGYYWWHTSHTDKVQTAGARGRRGNGPEAPIPVTAAKAEVRNVPIYLDGLGTVQAFNLVSIKAMIDGPLTQVTFAEGQDVKAGDVLARIDQRPYQASLDAAVAKKQQDEATLANNKLDLARYTKLAPTLGSSQQQLDTARAQVVLQEALVRGDQAQIDTARTNLSYTTIQAPFDGRTGIRQVDVGNIVHAADTTPLTTITQLKPISVIFTLPQQALGAVAAAMAQGKPQVLALMGDGSGQVLDRGVLAVLDNQVDASTGTIKLKATFPNDQLKLWPGGFVNVRLLVDTARGATTVPTSAIQRGPRGPYVFIVNPDTTVKRTTVKLGHEDEVTTIVTAGLKPGDQVVTDGAQRLNDTSKAAIAGPDGNAPDAIPLELRAPGTAQERSAPGTGPRRQRNAG
jgi:multidrug efflux system membrane fusion protein